MVQYNPLYRSIEGVRLCSVYCRYFVADGFSTEMGKCC
jgi:hypothetical protein